MLLHCHSELKQQVESWQNWLKETQPSQQRNPKFSRLMLTINQVFASKSSKGKDQWLKTTTSLEASIWMESHQPQEAFHKSKSPLKLMRMVSWMSQPPTREHQRMLESQLPTTRADFQKMKLKSLSRMLKNTKTKTKKLEEKLKPKTVLKATAWMSNTQSTMKSSKERSAKKKKELFWARFQNFKDGFHLILMLKQANLKANRRNLKLFTTR